MNNSNVISARVNVHGLYEFSFYEGTRLPDFLRPRPVISTGGLARQTSEGNYHGPFVERRVGREILVLNETAAQEAFRVIQVNGLNLIML